MCDSRNLTLQTLMSDRVETVRSTIEAHYDNETSWAESVNTLRRHRGSVPVPFLLNVAAGEGTSVPRSTANDPAIPVCEPGVDEIPLRPRDPIHAQ
jgi:hypothetical protein